MSAHIRSAGIGGYFSLECGIGQGLSWLQSAAGYQSARSAIAAALTCAKPRAVWAPYYICNAVNDALLQSGVIVHRYKLSNTYGVPVDVKPEPSDWLICVDYFGINNAAVDDALDRFGCHRVLVDASQALFHRIRPGGTGVYSIRKFVGVPDGGFLISNLLLGPRREPNEIESFNRSRHLLARLSGAIEQGYAYFQDAEASLTSCEPVAMSQLTYQLIASIDFTSVAERRVTNYSWMAAELKRKGLKVLPLPDGAVPLCCPVLEVNALRIKQKLSARSIFTPTYWPELTLPEADTVARSLRDTTVFMPCDQRLRGSDVEYAIRSLLEAMDLQ